MCVVELGEPVGQPLQLMVLVRDFLLELLGGRDRLPGDPGQPVDGVSRVLLFDPQTISGKSPLHVLQNRRVFWST